MKRLFYVEVIDNNGSVVKCIGPLAAWRADRVEAGVNINLNHDEYFTRQTLASNATTPDRQAEQS